MVQFISMPQFQGGNALDFSPIGNALEANRNYALKQNAETKAEITKIGNALEANRNYALKQNADQRAQQKNSLDIEKTKAEIAKMNRIDPVDQMISERLKSLQGPQQAPQQQPMQAQPQSFQGGPSIPRMGAQPVNAPQMPQGGQFGLQTIADVQPQGGAPAPQQSAPDMIDTPYGRMSRQEAIQLGGTMLLKPQYSAAGKAILEAAQGGTGAGGMSKPAETQLDERTISAASTIGRLQDIKKQFKPEFQEIPNRIKMLGASWGAALGQKLGGKLNPELTKSLTEFSQFQAAGFNNFNQILKELSGTAVSTNELQRQQFVQPDPGSGIFDGDDPVTFMAKMNQVDKFSRAAIARMNFMRSKGLQFNKDTAEQFLSIEDVPGAIDKRGAEIENQLKQQNPGADPMSIQKATQDLLKKEFGI